MSEIEPKRRRGSKRPPDAPEPSESDLISALRSRSWAWLAPRPAPDAVEEEVPVPVAPAAPSNDVIAEPPKRKRAAKKDASADGIAALRRRAWTWLAPKAAPAAAPIAEAGEASPKRKRSARKDATPDGTAILRLRAWSWFAPKAAAARTERRTATADPAFAGGEVVRSHLKGTLEALIFASEHPLPARELARIAKAEPRVVKALLTELSAEYHARGFRLDEVAGGYVFRTSPVFAPFVREQVAKKPVKMSRAQIETLAIVAYRQPITRPEVDDVRGVDSGAVLKSLLERSLVRILGKKDEPGRPMLYGTTADFLEFFGLKALADLPTLREFTELSDESKRTFERELGEEPPDVGAATGPADGGLMGGEGAFRRGEAKIDVEQLENDPTAPSEPATDDVTAPSEPATDDVTAPSEPATDDVTAPQDPTNNASAPQEPATDGNLTEPRASASGPEPRASASEDENPGTDAAEASTDDEKDEKDEEDEDEDEEDEDEDEDEDEEDEDEEDEDEDEEDEDEEDEDDEDEDEE